jgi:hypothetical protein
MHVSHFFSILVFAITLAAATPLPADRVAALKHSETPGASTSTAVQKPGT